MGAQSSEGQANVKEILPVCGVAGSQSDLGETKAKKRVIYIYTSIYIYIYIFFSNDADPAHNTCKKTDCAFRKIFKYDVGTKTMKSSSLVS